MAPERLPQSVTVLDLEGRPVAVAALAERRPVVLALLRHYG
jgi:hypothetical protein